jgi:acyl-CoA dehydrogenase
VGTPAQKERWLQPIVRGDVRSAFAMTEPHPGGGSDPSMIQTRAEKRGGTYVVHGRKWFITGAGEASHFILIARTSDDPRYGLTALLFHKDQPSWEILRRIPIMGPEEHGGHCEIAFTGLEIPEENVLIGEGQGLKATQIRLGPARLTHCMRWLGLSKRSVEIAQAYAAERTGFGQRLADRESIQLMLGDLALQIEIGRMLVMKAAWELDQGSFARKEVSMAKLHVANVLHQAADVGIQINGARGYSKDTVLNRFLTSEESDFWHWPVETGATSS